MPAAAARRDAPRTSNSPPMINPIKPIKKKIKVEVLMIYSLFHPVIMRHLKIRREWIEVLKIQGKKGRRGQDFIYHFPYDISHLSLADTVYPMTNEKCHIENGK
jgi:hypothetical protein